MRPIRRSRTVLLGLALATADTASAQDAGNAAAQTSPATQIRGALTEVQVRATLEAQSYTDVNDIGFDDGMWKADARSADGNRVDLRLDPGTGEIYPETMVSNLSESDVRARLSTAGYTDAHDVEYDDGIWKAEAEDPAGRDVEVRIDARDGRIIGQEKD